MTPPPAPPPIRSTHEGGREAVRRAPRARGHTGSSARARRGRVGRRRLARAGARGGALWARLRRQPRVRRAGHAARRGRRGGAHPARFGRGVRPLRRASLARARSSDWTSCGRSKRSTSRSSTTAPASKFRHSGSGIFSRAGRLARFVTTVALFTAPDQCARSREVNLMFSEQNSTLLDW